MKKQRGSVLILSLLILLVMTMLGVTAMSTSTLEEKMAANDRNQKAAFQRAELELSGTEEGVRVDHWNNDFYTEVVTGTVGYYAETAARPDYFDQATWSTGSATCTPAQNTCHIIKILDQPPPLEQGGGYGQLSQSNMPAAKLTITAMGTDASGNSRSIVQSTFEKKIIP